MSDRLLKKSPFNIVHALMEYPTPINLSYMWNFGSLSGIILGIQIATGIILAMHYTPHVDYAFLSVEHIMRDVNYGWLIRYTHANGASMFFLLVYLHMARGLYYGSYGEPRGPVWNIGVIIFLALMAVGFLGYVLPWGQMSFWGATVITNFFSAIPIIGESVVYWLWGGFSVDNATLNRFFSLHFFIPFLIAALALIHVFILHDPKSGNPLGLDSSSDRIPFHPYFTVKDVFGLIIFLIFFSYFIFFNPNVLGHTDNYILANPMVTPPHIVPEWYYLPFYAILRAVPHKLGGIIAMIGAILILLILPFTNTSRIRSSAFRPIHRKFYWIFIADVLLLLWIGGNPAEQPYTTMGLFCSIYYFFYLIILIPIIGSIENVLLTAGFDEYDDEILITKKDSKSNSLRLNLETKINSKIVLL